MMAQLVTLAGAPGEQGLSLGASCQTAADRLDDDGVVGAGWGALPHPAVVEGVAAEVDDYDATNHYLLKLWLQAKTATVYRIPL